MTSARNGDRPSQAERMTFAPGPVLASGGQINSTTKSPNTGIHVTLYSALESGDMGADSKVWGEEPTVS